MKNKSTIKKKSISKPCAVAFCMSMIGGTWKPIILFRIAMGIHRFEMLMKSIDGINRQMLSKRLKELEKADIIERKVFLEIPPRVEYSFTIRGKSLLPVIQSMNRWGKKHQELTSSSTAVKSSQLPLFDSRE
ncbi:MAG: helix-turn-helix domain-containing protein [Flavobacteriaceae bacterium]